MQGPIPITNSNIPSGDPDPLFARTLQQALGGVEDEIRVAMQNFFPACGARNPNLRGLLMNTAAVEQPNSGAQAE
jgi:Mn-containing catalase